MVTAAVEAVSAATAAEWRNRSIYQVMTDRYSRTDGSMEYQCDTWIGKYCGGTWKGVAKDLDYIKNMGFSAVSQPLAGKGTLLIHIGLDISHHLPNHSIHQRFRRLPWILAGQYQHIERQFW